MDEILLYVGAWSHVDPILHFPSCRVFVFVDSQPRCQHESELVPSDTFVEEVTDACAQIGFFMVQRTLLSHTDASLDSLDVAYHPTLYVFKDELGRELRYYMSVTIGNPAQMGGILCDLQRCTGLIVSGHHPHADLWNHVTIQDIYCYTRTWYSLGIFPPGVRLHVIHWSLGACGLITYQMEELLEYFLEKECSESESESE